MSAILKFCERVALEIALALNRGILVALKFADWSEKLRKRKEPAQA